MKLSRVMKSVGLGIATLSLSTVAVGIAESVAWASSPTIAPVTLNNIPILSGKIIATYPSTAAGCSLPSSGLPSLDLHWKMGAATPYVDVALNKRCQFIVTAVGTDPVETPVTAGMRTARSSSLIQHSLTNSTLTAQSTSTCTYQDHVDVVDLSSWTTGAEVTNWMDYAYPCGGNYLDSGTTNSSCYWNETIGYTLDTCNAGWNFFDGGSAQSYGSGFEENNDYMGYIYGGTLSVTNTVNARSWTITAHCSWGGSLQQSGDTFHCAAFAG